MTPQKTVQVALWCLEKGGVRFVTGRILATACENWFGFLPGNFLLGRVAKACLSMLRQHRFWANTISLVRANLLTGNKRDCPKWFCFNIPGEGRFPSVGFVTDAEVGKMLLLIELGRILASNWAKLVLCSSWQLFSSWSFVRPVVPLGSGAPSGAPLAVVPPWQ